MRRRRISRKRSKKIFRKGANRVHKRNLQTTGVTMRGGTRM